MSRLQAIARRFAAVPATLPEATESFDPGGDREAGEIVRLQLRRPIVLGMIVVLVLVFGLLIWAAIATVSNAVLAPGVVKVENNSKTLRHREGGTIRRILVREGQFVRAGQPLIQFDQVQPQASVDLFRATYDTALANMARFEAEAANAPAIRFPAELIARRSDPRVGMLLASEQSLFDTRMALYRSQAVVLRAQAQQIQTQISGLRAQTAASDFSASTVNDELAGVRELEQQGYAPKTRRLALERSAAGIKGQQGSLMAEIARARQGIGEVQLQIAQLEDRRQTEAAAGMREAQDKLADAAPKLRATTSSLTEATVRAPVDGYVFALTQFTEGGVAQPGEQLMQIVPSGQPLLVTAHVPTTSISDVRVGLPARITLSAYNTRTTDPVEGTVALVGADAQSDEATRQSFYIVQIRVDPASLAKAGPNVRLTPGMPTQVAIVTGKRTILDYLLEPFTDALRSAFRER